MASDGKSKWEFLGYVVSRLHSSLPPQRLGRYTTDAALIRAGYMTAAQLAAAEWVGQRVRVGANLEVRRHWRPPEGLEYPRSKMRTYAARGKGALRFVGFTLSRVHSGGRRRDELRVYGDLREIGRVTGMDPEYLERVMRRRSVAVVGEYEIREKWVDSQKPT